jgi:hypothetical protein
MAKIAYVDHSYHKTTVSTKFLPDLLEDRGHQVDFFWDNKWQGGKAVNFKEVEHYDVVIMFQSFCEIANEQFFSKLHKNIIYIPMLDQFGIWRGPINSNSHFWKTFQGCKVLNFSTAVHGMTVGMGIRSKLVRFYRKPIEYREIKKGLHGFLWIRLEDEISWLMVKKLIGNTKFDSFHIHMAKDPGSSDIKSPSDEDMKKYNITLSTWFDKKEDFEKVLEKSNVYFTPRMEEGIGQSFLEAFARGQCVVAPNNGTMNEYIQNNFTGLLYEWENPQPLDFSNVLNITQYAHTSNVVGYKNWLNSYDDLVDFILMSNHEAYKNRYDYFLDYNESKKCSLKMEIFNYLKSKFNKIEIARTIYRKYKGI